MNKVSYSPNEERLLNMLKSNKGPISGDKLRDMFYEGQEKPWNAQKIVNATMGTLIKKSEFNKEKFKIVKSPRRGARFIEYKMKNRGR